MKEMEKCLKVMFKFSHFPFHLPFLFFFFVFVLLTQKMNVG